MPCCYRRATVEEAATIGNAASGVPAGDVSVRLDDVSKHFGSFVAVDDVSLDVRRGEFFSLLGPSGSGKTTCLRMIAGFERPTSGQVLLDGRDVTARAPYERDVNTVFQDYALFPHMTVQENVEYGLRVKRVAKQERRERAGEALALVRLGAFATRKPSQLSGGQRQRVALARALVNRPGVLLLDEPLGALDLKLRQEMQIELKHIQQTVGITFIYVTHDQEEALSMSDRLAVFNAGQIEQIGTPAEVHERPATAFVAGFVGTSNVLGDGRAVRPEKLRLESLGYTAQPGEEARLGTIVWLPFMILPVYAALERVPGSLIEASRDLGAKGSTTFRTVVLPLAFPGVVAGSIFTFSLTLGDFITPAIVGGDNHQLIGSVVYSNFGIANNAPFAAAFATVPLAIMAIYLIGARRLGAFDHL